MQICIKFNLYYLAEMNLIIQIFILYSSEFKLQSGSESPGMFVEKADFRFLLHGQVSNGVSIKDHKSYFCTVGLGYSDAGFFRSSFEKYSALQAHRKPFLHYPYLSPPYVTSNLQTLHGLYAFLPLLLLFLFFEKSFPIFCLANFHSSLIISFRCHFRVRRSLSSLRGTLVTSFPAFQ